MNNREYNKLMIKKLNQDDILEILLEYFQDSELSNFSKAKGILIGESNKDLRFIGVFADDKCEEVFECDLIEIDKNQEFNGSHAFLQNNPKFIL